MLRTRTSFRTFFSTALIATTLLLLPPPAVAEAASEGPAAASWDLLGRIWAAVDRFLLPAGDAGKDRELPPVATDAGGTEPQSSQGDHGPDIDPLG